MSISSDESRPSSDEPASNGRLDSWKEIAAYLRRSVRSAKRWEKEEQLPVHRHLHGKRDSVYAYRTELDGWWTNRGAKLTDQNGAEEARLPPEDEALVGVPDVGKLERSKPVLKSSLQRPRRTALVAMGIALAVGLAGVVALLSRNGSGPSGGSLRSSPLKARDWVLVTRFENRTGEPLFDDTVEYAVERELGDSRYVNVVPRQRVADTLRLMRKPPDTRVDAALGREICVRDGGIRALLTGRIDRLGTSYQLTVDVVDPKSGARIASFVQEAAERYRVAQTVRRASHRVREALSEAPVLVRRSEEKLASVTTPSLKAVQLYSKADTLLMEGQEGAAEELLKQALTEDSEFASGHIHLAWAIRRQNNRPEQDWRRPAERAFGLSADTSERERYFIRGSFYAMTGQYENAKSSYEALLGLHPDHYWAAKYICGILSELGQFGAAADYAARFADLNSGDFGDNYNAAISLLAVGRQSASEIYRLRAESLVSPEAIRLKRYQVTKLQFLPAYGLWLRAEAGRALEIVSRRSSFKGSREDQASVDVIASFYLLLGRLRDAEEWLRRMDGPMERESALAMVAFDRGDTKAMGRHLLQAKDATGPRLICLPYLLLRAGLVSEAEKQIKVLEALGGTSPSYFDIARGELVLARGQRGKAITLLRRGLRGLDTAAGASLMGSESLARALEGEGKLGEAAEVLERVTEAKARTALFFWYDNTSLWMRTRIELARVYRRMGRESDARNIEEELRKLLACADPDHVLLRELQHVNQS